MAISVFFRASMLLAFDCRRTTMTGLTGTMEPI